MYIIRVLGSEFYLACGVVAYELLISEYRVLGSGLQVRGLVKLRNYLNNKATIHNWQAQGQLEDYGKVSWYISDANSYDASAPLTDIAEVNEELEFFIAGYLPSRPLSTPRIIKRPKYRGPYKPYTGPCVCNDLYQDRIPSCQDWQWYMDGTHFPSRCFRCSCDRHIRWWQPSPDIFSWYQVKEDSLWKDLLKHNGCCGRAIILYSSPKEVRWLEGREHVVRFKQSLN